MKEKETNEYINLIEDLLAYCQDKIDLMERAQKSKGSKKELYEKNIRELDLIIFEKKARMEEMRRMRRIK